MKKTKILIYFTHKESLGHSTRTLSIIHSIIKSYGHRAKIGVFQAGKEQPCLKIPKGVSWFNLPNPFYSKLNFRRGSSNVLVPLYAKIRAKYMLEKIKEFKPDIFITEFFPFGREDCRFELLPILTFLKRKSIRVFSSIGYPYIVRHNIDIMTAHCHLYDKFFIHTPGKLEYNFLKNDIDNPLLKAFYKKTFDNITDRLLYTGYIMPFNAVQLKSKEAIRDSLNANNRKLVVVSRGGGVRYPKIISHSIAALGYLPKEYLMVVASGPSTSRKEMALFKQIGKDFQGNSLKLFRYLEDLPSYLNACDVSVSMAGYNTSVPLLYLKKPTVLIPSSEDPETALGYCCEQISRARLMQTYIGSRIIDYHDLTPQKIAKLIHDTASVQKLPAKSKMISDEWFKGAENTADAIFNA